jgi:hypothetical protein
MPRRVDAWMVGLIAHSMSFIARMIELCSSHGTWALKTTYIRGLIDSRTVRSMDWIWN